LSQGFPVQFVLQDKKDRAIKILDELDANYMFSNDFKHMHISPKINNQITGIMHLPKDTDIIVFIDADVYLLPDSVKNLIQPIKDGKYKICTGKRIIDNKYILKAWSFVYEAMNIGIYGGLFAVEYKWFMEKAFEDFSNHYADDWSVYLSAISTKTKIHHCDSFAFCSQDNIDRFLVRQYCWMKKYSKRRFYSCMFLETISIPFGPLKSLYIYYKTKCIGSSLAALFLSIIIVWIQIKVIFKKSINWSGFQVKI